MTTGNLFEHLPASLGEEVFTELDNSKHVRISRIVSTGQASPLEGWYDQADNEWVIVLRGEARLEIEGSGVIHLQAGSHLNIPAHTRHKVVWTSQVTETIWLAVHYD